MKIIRKTANPNGAYSPIQSWGYGEVPNGYAIVPDTLDTADFYNYNGFITLTIEGDTVAAYTPNVEAWEAWKANLPTIVEEEVPSQLDRIEAQVAYIAMMTDTLLEEE